MKKKTRDFEAKDLVIPIWKALLAVVIYFLVWLMLWLFSKIIHSSILDTTVSVLLRLFYIVFFLSIISSYANHFKKIGSVSMVAPALNALSSTIIIYFLAYLFTAINRSLGIDFIDKAGTFVTGNIMLVLTAMLCLSYLFYLAEKSP